MHDVTAARREENNGFTATKRIEPKLTNELQNQPASYRRRSCGDVHQRQITGLDVEMLREVLDEEEGGLAIDLENVSLVDREAVKLLARCESSGTELRNCPLYIREWVTRERAETEARPSQRL